MRRHLPVKTMFLAVTRRNCSEGETLDMMYLLMPS
jgi:hypothetical protein